MRISDWSSDVCSSDLPGRARNLVRNIAPGHGIAIKARGEHGANQRSDIFTHLCRYRQSRGCPCHGDISRIIWPIRALLKPEALHRFQPLRHIRSEEHTSELQSLLRIPYAVFGLKNNINTNTK